MSSLRTPLALSLVCLLAAVPIAAQDTTTVRRTTAGILVDFQDVDLRAVIMSLAEAGNLNVSYSDLPAKRVTLRLRSPVPVADILPLLRSLAQSNGLQVTQEGSLVKFAAAEAQGINAQQAAQEAARKAAESRLFVYRLKHVRAAKLAGTLQSIFGRNPQGPQAPQAGGLPPTLSQQLSANVLRPNPGADTAATPVIAAVLGAAVTLPGMLQGEVQIVPEETTNSIVIHASAADYEIVRQAIEALDLRPLQVLIEVLIAEVRQSSDLDLAVAAQARRTEGTNGPVIATSTTSDLIVRLSREATFNINVAVRALQSRGDVRILSRPVLLAQNNQEAKILVGTQRPFVQVFRSLPTDAAVRDQVVQYKDVGTSLTILPTINSDGYVNLQVSQEVSTATEEVQFGAPIISTREASTHLFVRDGQTAVLGGLMDRQQDKSRTGIPGLVGIPGLGLLFGSYRDNKTSSELYLFVTPHVVVSDEDADLLRKQIEERSPDMTKQLPKNPPLPGKPPVKPPMQ